MKKRLGEIIITEMPMPSWKHIKGRYNFAYNYTSMIIYYFFYQNFFFLAKYLHFFIAHVRKS